MDDITELAAELGRRLQLLNAHVTTAESCTAGLIAATLADEAAPFVSPKPGVPPEVFLAGVAAVRRGARVGAGEQPRARMRSPTPAVAGAPAADPLRAPR